MKEQTNVDCAVGKFTWKSIKISKNSFLLLLLQAVFERLVDMICDKMSESLDADPALNSNKGTRLTDTAQPSNVNCNC